MNYSRQLKEADRILQDISSTHHNILSIGGDVLNKYEQMCEDRVQTSIEETTQQLLREQTELREKAIAQAVEEERQEREVALKEAWKERGHALTEREREVRGEMEIRADRLLSEEKERGEERLKKALLAAEESSRKALLTRIEEVRLEEQRITSENLAKLSKEMEMDTMRKISEIQQEDENILNSSIQDLEDGHKVNMEQIRKQDKKRSEEEVNEMIEEFNSKLNQKQTEVESDFATIHKLEEELEERDEKIKQLEIKYENSRVEFSHFVDTISGLGGAYTVNNEIL